MNPSSRSVPCRFSLLALSPLVFSLACGGSDSTEAPLRSGQGGRSGASGASLSSAGSRNGAAGTEAQAGGNDSAGGPSQAGSPGKGGLPSLGGALGKGGSTSQAGSPGKGGLPSLGGAVGKGGSTSQAGSPGKGGLPSLGGAAGKGGSASQAGSPGKGGLPSLGGAAGKAGSSPQAGASQGGAAGAGNFSPTSPACKLVINQGFDQYPGAMQTYTQTAMERDWGATTGPYKGLDGRTMVGNSTIQAFFAKGALLGQDTGFSWFSDLPGAPEEAIMEYRMKFSAGYDWTLGGKLPGLCGGTCPRGCTDSFDQGFSMRNMWRKDGGMVTYAYWPDKSAQANCGTDWQWSNGVVSGKWYTVRQQIKLNNPNQADGVIEAYLDGVLVQRKADVRFRLDGTVSISKAYLTTYVGGSTDAFRPSQDQYIWFDSFKVWVGCSR